MTDRQPTIDLEFPVRGKAVPVDHGYTLYSACSHLLSDIHSDKWVGIFPIQGSHAGGDTLLLNRASRLTFRILSDQVGRFLPLAGKTLDVAGYQVAVGVPNLRMLKPVASLLARTVTIKGFMEEAAFLEATRRQLLVIAPGANASLLKRRTIQIAGKQVVGFKVLLEGLSAEESIAVQEMGIGGRRRFGCGLFAPVKR